MSVSIDGWSGVSKRVAESAAAGQGERGERWSIEER